MKRRNRFLIALVSAAITFSTLTAIAGPAHWHRGWERWHEHGHCDRMHKGAAPMDKY